MSTAIDPSVLQSVAMSILMCPCHERAAREHSELPEEEKKLLWSDLTGIDTQRLYGKGVVEYEEPNTLVQKSLIRLQLELDRIEDKPAYDQALKRSPVYVTNQLFRVRFLRAEKFDCHAAAVRMKCHFEIKLKLFGPDKLGREILLSDLDQDDMESMNMGYFQVVSSLDSNNRTVVLWYKAISNCYKHRENIVSKYIAHIPKKASPIMRLFTCHLTRYILFHSLHLQLRTLWYIFNVISHDEVCQKRGVVSVVYNNGGFPKGGMDYEKSRRFGLLVRGIPIRMDSILVCLDESLWLNVVDAFSVIVSKHLRIRMRTLPGK
jgi:hypothetical protein